MGNVVNEVAFSKVDGDLAIGGAFFEDPKNNNICVVN